MNHKGTKITKVLLFLITKDTKSTKSTKVIVGLNHTDHNRNLGEPWRNLASWRLRLTFTFYVTASSDEIPHNGPSFVAAKHFYEACLLEGGEEAGVG